MAAAHQKPEAIRRGARMLRTALGPAIARFLEDPAIVEVMLNPDGRLWIDRLRDGLAQTGQTLFLNAAPDRQPVSAERIRAPASPYLLQAGAVIPAALITGIRSDLPGQIVAQVTEPVYDSPSGRYLLIPQGTRLVGEYSDAVSFGERRVLLLWNRLTFPDGRSLVLERLPGADAQGFAGLEDGVDYHWGDMAKAAGLSTVLAIGTEIGSEDDDPLVRAIREGAGDTIADAGQQIVERQLQVAPTLSIRQGFPLRIVVTKDLILEPQGG